MSCCEATTVFREVVRDIVSNIASKVSIATTHADAKQRWYACYTAFKDNVFNMEKRLACQPELCVAYYTKTSKPAGLMILENNGEHGGIISAMITSLNDDPIEEKLTEYAVNTLYSWRDHHRHVYLQAKLWDWKDTFRSMGFQDENDGSLSLNPRASDKWDRSDNRWVLKGNYAQIQP